MTKPTKTKDDLAGLVARAVADAIGATGVVPPFVEGHIRDGMGRNWDVGLLAPTPTRRKVALSAHHWESDMPNRFTHEQIAAHDDKGERHVVMVTRSPIPGSPHLRGLPHYTWNEGQTLHLIDARAGVLECVLTGQRLKIEDWHG